MTRRITLAGLPDVAAELLNLLSPPKTVYLRGALGAGKTTLVRAILGQAGYEGPVPSPTFSLVETYDAGGLHFHHFDLYRIENADEIEFLAIRDRLDDRSVVLFEWPEKARSSRGEMLIPPADLSIDLKYDSADPHYRLISWTAHSAPAQEPQRADRPVRSEPGP